MRETLYVLFIMKDYREEGRSLLSIEGVRLLSIAERGAISHLYREGVCLLLIKERRELDCHIAIQPQR